MNALQAHIQEKNAEKVAWVAEDPKNRWSAMLVDDPAHWAEMGIHTVEEFEKYVLVSDIYETTRSCYGYKPNWNNLMSLSIAELHSELALLENECVVQLKREQEAVALKGSYPHL